MPLPYVTEAVARNIAEKVVKEQGGGGQSGITVFPLTVDSGVEQFLRRYNAFWSVSSGSWKMYDDSDDVVDVPAFNIGTKEELENIYNALIEGETPIFVKPDKDIGLGIEYNENYGPLWCNIKGGTVHQLFGVYPYKKGGDSDLMVRGMLYFSLDPFYQEDDPSRAWGNSPVPFIFDFDASNIITQYRTQITVRYSSFYSDNTTSFFVFVNGVLAGEYHN